MRDDITLDKRGRPVECGHANCSRPAVRIIAAERPKHREFKGQAHDCCSTHSRTQKARQWRR